MDNVYYIKAYFTKQGQEQAEIRRFKIDISSENDAYQELHAKIESFQSNNDFTLQYVDEENERITFNSNDELRSAMAMTGNANTLKVYVTSSQPLLREQKAQETAGKECHVGVECDSCKGPVIGFRYKCFVCPNYDLCEKCSAAGVHSEHNMIKITKPGNSHYPPHPHHHHIPPPPHHHIPPPPHHHIPPPPHHHVPPPPFFPNRQFLDQVQSQIPQWLPNVPNAAHFRTHMQQHLDTIKANTQSHVQNSRQYLESVGQYLQQTLSPFGIDCDYHVDDANPTPNQQETTTATATAAATTQQEEQTTTAHDEPPREPDAVPKYPDLSSEGKTTNEEPPTKMEQESTPINNPIEKAIDDCLEKMRAMGFVDTNGALRELIRSKNGEMNAVLDAINPRHYQA